MPDFSLIENIEDWRPEGQTPKDIEVKTADQLDNSPIEWLIPDWIPKKGITILGGDGGLGKSFTWVSILSALSKGESTFLHYEPGEHKPHTVLCFSDEDAENVLYERFKKAGACMSNIRVVAQDEQNQDLKNITFSDPLLELIIDKYKPDIVVFDPIQSYLDDTVDMSRRNHMRHAIRPLNVLSGKYHMPFLILSHTNKRDATGRNKLADSSDIWDFARSVMMVGFTDEKERYISLEKASYTDHMKVNSVVYTLEGGRVNFERVEARKMEDYVLEVRQNRKIDSNTKSKKSSCCDDVLLILSEAG